VSIGLRICWSRRSARIYGLDAGWGNPGATVSVGAAGAAEAASTTLLRGAGTAPQEVRSWCTSKWGRVREHRPRGTEGISFDAAQKYSLRLICRCSHERGWLLSVGAPTHRRT
jgi:hypothetical protein